ncbi:hypothetical protein ACT8ZV_14420 [Nocardioides sp. MAHUQ-72]|uniref:hypothetical protein n=1 Tax=unclassified Nocardioides TaxID=2615069 RepID=UPI00361F1ADD
MTTTLPVPIEFELPGPEWQPVVPESLGVENAAFLAVRQVAGEDYRPTITISGDWRDDPATLTDIADESLAKIRVQAEQAELLERRVIESEHAPAVTQRLRAVATTESGTFELQQAQAVTGLVDVADPTRRVVVIYTLTCTADQMPVIGREFQQFMATVHVVAPGEQS